MKITTIGLDLAKNVFQLHGVDSKGKTVLTRQLRRKQVPSFFAKLEPCLIGMEACAGAHNWARMLLGFGHEVKFMAPQFVKPYVKANKTDAADAEAISEAVTRPNMRFVPVKTVDQQAVLSLHRARSGFVKARGVRKMSLLLHAQTNTRGSCGLCWPISVSLTQRTYRLDRLLNRNAAIFVYPTQEVA